LVDFISSYVTVSTKVRREIAEEEKRVGLLARNYIVANYT
jgi:hypothetical protein